MSTKIVPVEGLKPCPFCGGKPVVKLGATTFADCQGCGAILYWHALTLRQSCAATGRRREAMTPEQIEEFRALRTQFYALENKDEWCDLALDGLRFRKLYEAREHNPTKLGLMLDGRTLDEYRSRLDAFIVERKG